MRDAQLAAQRGLLTFPARRIEDLRLREILEELAEAITTTNDPDTLRALGQSLRMMGAFARSEAFDMTRNHW
jgi:hypothetical protein